MIAVVLSLAAGSVAADPLLQVYAIRGFAGQVFSRGMNQLCDSLGRIPQVMCEVDDFYNETSIERRALTVLAGGQRLALVGHSWGAHSALRVAAAMNREVSLIVTVDPNWFPAPPAVPRNAEIVLNYYQDFDVLGRAMLQPAPAFKGELRQIRRDEGHVTIDRSPDIHAEIVMRVRAILSGPTMPQPRSLPLRPDLERNRR